MLQCVATARSALPVSTHLEHGHAAEQLEQSFSQLRARVAQQHNQQRQQILGERHRIENETGEASSVS